MNDEDAGHKQRAGKGRERGKGYAMGNKLQVTVMISKGMLEETDEQAADLGVARSVAISLALRDWLNGRKKQRT